MAIGAALDRTHEWFEHNSGWAPPDVATLAEWLRDGVCRAPDECLVALDGICQHGLASWWLVLADTDPLTIPNKGRLDPKRTDLGAVAAAHGAAIRAGEPGYLDPASGLFVMTALYLWERGTCCDEGCRHCPFPATE